MPDYAKEIHFLSPPLISCLKYQDFVYKYIAQSFHSCDENNKKIYRKSNEWNNENIKINFSG